MGTCTLCKRASPIIAKNISVCGTCIRKNFKQATPILQSVHARSRRQFNLPAVPPDHTHGVVCRLCQNRCSIAEDQCGYCGTRRNIAGHVTGGRPHEGNLSFYHDPLPTNCVGSWVCAGGTGAGYPRWANRPGPEYGYHNLAVFYNSCTFNCLYCQNYHFKSQSHKPGKTTSKKLAHAVEDDTSCICFFGGDPTPHLLHAIKTSRLALQNRPERIVRICWETNGAMDGRLLNHMARLSLESGGCIKFDLKAWSEEMHLALCGVSNRTTLENFRRLSGMAPARPELPFLIASTLLVPGYIDEEEVYEIASFIAALDPDIPYSLLAFYPHFYLHDLPTTSRMQAEACLKAALDAGLTRVHLGNIHLLQ